MFCCSSQGMEARDVSETLDVFQNLQRFKTKMKLGPEQQVVYLTVFEVLHLYLST